MRAVLERPNSKFLDLGVRYSSNDQNRLKSFKRIESVTRMEFRTLMCIIITITIFILLGVGVGLLVKYDVDVISFPILN